jgi:hypothetical protein
MRYSTRMMMRITGWILVPRAVEGAVLVMPMTMTTARVRRPRKGGEKGTVKGKETNDGKGNRKATEDGKGNGKGKGKGNGKGKGIAKHTPGGDDFSCAIAL